MLGENKGKGQKTNVNKNRNHTVIKQDIFIKCKLYVYKLRDEIREQEKIIQLRESSRNYISTNHSASGL